MIPAAPAWIRSARGADVALRARPCRDRRSAVVGVAAGPIRLRGYGDMSPLARGSGAPGQRLDRRTR